jgi:hypothetical protein
MEVARTFSIRSPDPRRVGRKATARFESSKPVAALGKRRVTALSIHSGISTMDRTSSGLALRRAKIFQCGFQVFQQDRFDQMQMETGFPGLLPVMLLPISR